MERQLRYGSWPSPISAELVAAGGVGLSGPAVWDDGAGQTQTWWSELRPSEGGRSVVVRRRGDNPAEDVLAPPWSARTRVHEYGGGAWWLGSAPGGTEPDLFFANWDDQRLYRLRTDAHAQSPPQPQALTPEPSVPGGWRFADGRLHPDGSWLACVREDHHPEPDEPRNELVAVTVPDRASVDGEPGEVTVLVSGSDFVSEPRFSPDGRWMSWIRWDHPNMPWDSTTLCAAPVFANRRLGNVQVVAGGPDSPEAVHGADWTSDGRLVFSGDRNGFWNLRSWSPGQVDSVVVTDLHGAEIGGPSWVFGLRNWSELEDGSLVVVVTTDAVDSLAVIEADPSLPAVPTSLPTPQWTAIDGLAPGRAEVTVVASGPTEGRQVATVDMGSGHQVTVVREPEDIGVDPSWFSQGQAIEFDSAGRRAHGFLYRPTAPGLTGPDGSAPPLIVIGHGGPTAHSGTALNLKIQYWTSRGFAVVDVNYGGSTGFGRDYRRLLDRSWGVVDVEDCTNAARHLAAQGLVDGDRLAIRGGSAGGLTVLLALIGSDIFAAGTSLYGVADLTALATDTHKFESRYLDGLVGPYPERQDLYQQRSPINHTDRLSSPMLVLQGLEDAIVPPSQSEAIVAALAAKGVPHAYVPFEGEQHGFRRAENIIRSLEVELWFYGRLLGFEPADDIEAPDGAVGL
jgi:dipeptidyl aminopeptidase/acylaminoacyl peptidase